MIKKITNTFQNIYERSFKIVILFVLPLLAMYSLFSIVEEHKRNETYINFEISEAEQKLITEAAEEKLVDIKYEIKEDKDNTDKNAKFDFSKKTPKEVASKKIGNCSIVFNDLGSAIEGQKAIYEDLDSYAVTYSSSSFYCNSRYRMEYEIDVESEINYRLNDSLKTFAITYEAAVNENVLLFASKEDMKRALVDIENSRYVVLEKTGFSLSLAFSPKEELSQKAEIKQNAKDMNDQKVRYFLSSSYADEHSINCHGMTDYVALTESIEHTYEIQVFCAASYNSTQESLISEIKKGEKFLVYKRAYLRITSDQLLKKGEITSVKYNHKKPEGCNIIFDKKINQAIKKEVSKSTEDDDKLYVIYVLKTTDSQGTSTQKIIAVARARDEMSSNVRVELSRQESLALAAEMSGEYVQKNHYLPVIKKSYIQNRTYPWEDFSDED